MMNYTKGEWRALPIGTGKGWYISTDEFQVAEVHEYHGTANQSRSNAHLIAASPRMYKALNKVREDINWMLNNEKFLNPDVFDYLDEALAKAE